MGIYAAKLNFESNNKDKDFKIIDDLREVERLENKINEYQNMDEETYLKNNVKMRTI